MRACWDIRTLRVQAGHQGLWQGPGMAEELLGAGTGWRIGTGGRKPYGDRKKHPAQAGCRARVPRTASSLGADLPWEKRLDPPFSCSHTEVSSPSLHTHSCSGLQRKGHQVPRPMPHTATNPTASGPDREEEGARPTRSGLGAQGRPRLRQRADLHFAGRLAARVGSAPAGHLPQTWPARRPPWLPSAE